MKKLLFTFIGLLSLNSFAISVGEIYTPQSLTVSILNNSISYENSNARFTNSHCRISSNQEARVLAINGNQITFRLIGKALNQGQECPNMTVFTIAQNQVNRKFTKMNNLTDTKFCKLSQSKRQEVDTSLSLRIQINNAPTLAQAMLAISNQCNKNQQNDGRIGDNSRQNHGQQRNNNRTGSPSNNRSRIVQQRG